MNLEFYDKKILDEIAGELQVPAEGLKQYDEKPKKAFLSRTVKGHTNSPEESWHSCSLILYGEKQRKESLL